MEPDVDHLDAQWNPLLEGFGFVRFQEILMYRGAGVLFTRKKAGGLEVFLILRRGKRSSLLSALEARRGRPFFQRLISSINASINSGVWSIPGGGREKRHANAIENAIEEAHEETGFPCPEETLREILKHLNRVWCPFVFDWQTFRAHLDSVPHDWPDSNAKDAHEYAKSGWFSVDAIPEPHHFLLMRSIEAL